MHNMIQNRLEAEVFDVLRPYQIEDIETLYQRGSGLVYHDMRL